MRKEKALISLLNGLVKLLGEEATRNPHFADELEALLSPVPVKTARRRKDVQRLDSQDLGPAHSGPSRPYTRP